LGLTALYKGGNGVASKASVASKAVADASGVITLASSAALETVEVGKLDIGDVLVKGLQIHTSDLGGAAITAQVVADSDGVLRSLDVITSEGEVKLNPLVSNVSTANRFASACSSVGAMNVDLVNNSVGQLQQGCLDVQDEIVEICGGGLESNRAGGEGLIQLGL
jgi:hypothetical protein